MIRHYLAAITCTISFAATIRCSVAAQVAPNSGASLTAVLPKQPPGLSVEITQPLTAADAVRFGLARNPQAAAGLAGVASAAANYKSLDAFPNLQLGVTRVQGTSTAPSLNGEESDTFVDVGDTVDTSGQRRYQAAGARAQYGVTRYQFDETKLSLEQQIRDAYWSLAAAQTLTKYAQESLQEAQRVYKLIQTQLQAGASPRVDVIRSSIDVANAQQAYISAQGGEKTALTALNVLLVRPPTAPLRLSETIEAGIDTKSSASQLPELAALTKSALAVRPLVKSAYQQVNAAEYAIKQTRASRYPDLAVNYERSLQTNVDSVMLSVSFPLLDFGTTHYSIKAAQETRKQAAAQKEQAEQQVIQQVAQAYQDADQAQSLLASYLTDILNPSITLREMAQLGYTQGATGILPVIDAESTLRNARTGYVNALLAVRKAQDEMAAALGTPAPR